MATDRATWDALVVGACKSLWTIDVDRRVRMCESFGWAVRCGEAGEEFGGW